MNNFKNKYGSIDIPGYTHYQKAMPSSIKLWTNAIIDSMKDNIKLITVIKKLTNQSPLGSAAGYNNYIKYDKKYCSEELGFNKVQYNPIYVQNSRGKFESSIIHGLNQIMYDLNKIASDIIFFSLSETSYFILSEKITTGSSIMPHKKNPDVLEILRANYHKTLAYEYFIKNNISNLISGYNRDIQLTKEPIINSFKILKESLHIINIVFKNIEININNCKKAMTYELYSTNEILEKISKSGNFRDAYFQISKKYNNSVSGG